MFLGVSDDRQIRRLNRLVETLDGRVGVKEVANDLAGHHRGDVAGGVAPHSVGHQGERIVDEHGILIRLSDQSGVGRRGITPTRQRTTSNNTPPTWTMSPRSSRTRPAKIS